MLDGNQLGDQIRQYIDQLTEEEKGNREAVFRAMGRAIVDYLKQNAEVYQVVIAPGIPLVAGNYAGSTTGPGQQQGTGKIK